MKPKRKVSPRSFVTQVAGAGGPSGGLGGIPKAASDHDLVHPAAHGGAVPGNDSDSDSGPGAGGGR